MDVPDQLLDDLRVNSNAKVLYAHLLRHWPTKMRGGTYIALADMAAAAGIGVTATRAALQQLKETGWVTVTQDRQEAGRFSSPRVYVNARPAGR